MPATIKIKNSSTASAVPTSSDLVQGELAVNVTDKRIFTENASGTVVELGTNPTILTMGAAGSASAPVITRTGDTNTGIFFPAADTIAFAEGGTEAMRLDSAGNMGLGVTSPSYRLDVDRGASNGVVAKFGRSGGQAAFIYADGTSAYFGSDAGISNGIGFSSTANQLQFYTNSSERARIDSSGNLLVGTTSNSDYSSTVKFYSVSSTYAGAFKSTGGASFTTLGIWNTASSGTISLVNFLVGAGSSTGSITSNGTTTTYGTSSDYRLKENIVPMTGALATVAQLKPCTYTWKSNGSSGQGFIAHELQAIVPDAVTGEKDAVNEDGSIKTQNIDTSFLVATLTAAIQELKAEFDAYKASHP